jgi:hypothetical protein
MSVDYASLMATQPETYGHASEAWAQIRETFDRYVSDYSDNVLGKVNRSGWSGGAAYAAHGALLDGLARVNATTDYLEGVCILLADAAVGIADAKAMVNDAVLEAQAASLYVDRNGAVQIPTPLLPTPAILGTADSVRAKIDEALALASEVDDAVFAGLGNAYKFIDGTWLRDAHQDLHDIRNIGPALTYQFGDDGLDRPLRPWNTADAGARDHWLYAQMMFMAAGLEATGRPTAASLFMHWLDNSGAPAEVSPAEMMREIPAFRQAVDDFVTSQGTGSFDSGWHNGAWLNDAANRTSDAEQDWYYALNDFRWRVVGTSSVIDGQPAVQYTVEVYKNWQFNADHPPITVPLPGHVQYEQSRLVHLNEVGLARDFVVAGSSYFSE